MERHDLAAESGDEAGTVTLTTASAAAAGEVWEALTNPSVIRHWFGTLTPTLSPGVNALLDFGDGDFFTLEAVELDPPHRIRYRWRFLGTGPLDTITWRVVPQDLGCLITVTDAEPGRTLEEALELREGWLDFSGRLQLFLSRHEDTRYACRSEFEGSIELPAGPEDAWDCLSASETQALWLPLDGPVLKDGARLTVVDDAGQLRVKLSSVSSAAPTGYRFRLKHPYWFSPMDCSLELTPRRDGTLFKVRHGGWRGQLNTRDEGERLRQRKRFSAFWVGVLRQARWLVEQTSNAKTQARPDGSENRRAGANP